MTTGPSQFDTDAIARSHEQPIGRCEEPATTPTCAACGVPALADFFELKRVPIHVGIFWDTREEALRAPMGSVTLAHCTKCGLVHNRQFDPGRLFFKPGYEVALHHSPTFRKFIEGVAARLIDRFDLHEKSILEIGCGDGYFLKRLCEAGANRGIGIDPTVPKIAEEPVGGGHVRFIRDYFSPQSVDEPVDFVCSLSVFESVPRPLDFLKSIREMLGSRRVPIYLEVFNAMGAFERGDVWSVHYEQCNYFGQASLTNLFQRAGFEVVDTATCYDGDQYLFVDAMPTGSSGPPSEARSQHAGPLPTNLQAFATSYRTRFQEWQRRLEKIQQQGQRIVVWGSGGKGISFLNALNATDAIEYVVEINPDKHGKFVPGTGQQIVSPDFLAEYRPDKVVITNRLYEQEMKAQTKQLGVDCEFLIA